MYFRYAISIVTLPSLRIVTIRNKCPPRTQQRPEVRPRPQAASS